MSRTPIPVAPVYPAPSAQHIERAVFISMRLAARGATNSDHAILSESARFFPDDVTVPMLLRAATDVGTTTAPGWAAELVRTSAAAFLADLAPQSAVAALMARGTVLPMGAYGSIVAPQRTGGPVARGFVAEGEPIPVTALTLGSVTIAPKKFGVICCVSREVVMQSPGGDVAVTDALRADAAASLDAGYFHDGAASAASPAGLLNGVSPIIGTAAPAEGMALLAKSVGTGGSGEVAFITGAGTAAALSLRADIKATVLPSTAVSDDMMIAIDPRSIVHAVGEVPDILAAEEATLHMSDTPLEIVSSTGPTTADPVRSTYPTNSIALRLLVDAGFAKRRAGAVAFMDITGWSW